MDYSFILKATKSERDQEPETVMTQRGLAESCPKDVLLFAATLNLTSLSSAAVVSCPLATKRLTTSHDASKTPPNAASRLSAPLPRTFDLEPPSSPPNPFFLP